MTGPNDIQPAIPTDQPTTPEAPVPAQPVTPVDPDETELLEAHAAAQAEEAAAKAPGAEPAEGAAPPTEAPPAAPARMPLIPKARLDEALSGQEKARQDAAYWRGVAEGRAQPAGTPGTAQPAAQPTPQDRLVAIDAAIDALAVRFDNGDITMADYKREERKLTNEAATIREDALVAKVKPTAATAGGDSELYLETLTADLETAHPWVAVFDAVGTEADWSYLKSLAVERLKERGCEMKGTVGRYELRKEVASLAEELGPGLLTTRATKAGVALPGQKAPTSEQTQQPLSPAAKARLAKLGTHANAPPNLANMGGGTSPAQGDLSESQLEALSDEDYDKLPAAVRNKLKLGATA